MTAEGERPAASTTPTGGHNRDHPRPDPPPAGGPGGGREREGRGGAGASGYRPPAGAMGRDRGRPPGQPGERATGEEQREDRRRRREGPEGRAGRAGAERRATSGFGDGIERAYCAAARHLLPETFPVVHRQGLATLRVTTVATRPGAILLCDGAHPGPHRWPDGDQVQATDPSTANAPEVPPPPHSGGPEPARAAESTVAAAEDTDEGGP